MLFVHDHSARLNRASAYGATWLLASASLVAPSLAAVPFSSDAHPSFIQHVSGPADAHDTIVRQRAEDLADAASKRFGEILQQDAVRIAQAQTAPQSKSVTTAPSAAADQNIFEQIWSWANKSSDDYQSVLRRLSGGDAPTAKVPSTTATTAARPVTTPSAPITAAQQPATTTPTKPVAPAAQPKVAQQPKADSKSPAPLTPAPAPAATATTKTTGPSAPPGTETGIDTAVVDWLAKSGQDYNIVLRRLTEPAGQKGALPGQIAGRTWDPVADAEKNRATTTAPTPPAAGKPSPPVGALTAEATRKTEEERRIAEQRRAADATKTQAESKRLADAKAAIDARAALEAKAIADAKAAVEKAAADSKRAVEAKAAAEKAAADEKVAADAKRVADAKAAVDKAVAEL